MRALVRTSQAKDLTDLILNDNHPELTTTDHPREYIVRIKATALTRGELAWLEPLEPEVPIPGYDFAGIVLAVPDSVDGTTFRPGDEVYGMTAPFSKPGNARETAHFSEKELCLKPTTLSWEEAATVPLSALTAWQGLFTHGGLKELGKGSNKGKRVLVTAASGGVGIWATQLAHQAGAQVVATCGTSNVDFVGELGADIVLDYSHAGILSWVNEDPESRAFDVVLDCIGGHTLVDAWKCAKQDGMVISVAEPAELKRPSEDMARGVNSVWFVVEANPDELLHITALIEQGEVQGKVDSIFPLESWREAFVRLESGHAKGKVVLVL